MHMGWERVLEAGSHTRSARGVSGLVPVHLYPGAHTRAASLPVRLRSCVHELLHRHHFQLLHCVNACVSARSGARAAHISTLSPQNRMSRRSCSAQQHILCAEQYVQAVLQHTSAHSLRRTRCSGARAAHIRHSMRRDIIRHPLLSTLVTVIYAHGGTLGRCITRGHR